MSLIYWDSMLFMYWFEGSPDHTERLEKLHVRMRERRDVLCTSIFTLGEVLTGPYKKNAMDVAKQTRDLLRPPLVELIPFNAETTEHFARIRAANRVSSADAIHLASAAQHRVNLFITNDRRLTKLVVPGIDFIAGLDANFF
jgi:predicted nucleic acid-binding protein